MHLPAARNLVFSHHRNVVLGLARHHAGITSDATIQVDGHAPGVAVVRVGRDRWKARFPRLPHGSKSGFLRNSSSVAPRTNLRCRAATLSSSRSSPSLPMMWWCCVVTSWYVFPVFSSVGAADPGVFGGRKQVGVEASARTHMPRAAPSVTQVQSEGIVGLAWRNPDGRFHRLPVPAQFHHIAVVHPQLPGARGADQRGVVPGQLGERLGQFLQPAIVRETAIPDGGIGAQRRFRFLLRSLHLPPRLRAQG